MHQRASGQVDPPRNSLGQVHLDGQTTDPRWRRFAEAAADAGISSVLSFPLRMQGEVVAR